MRNYKNFIAECGQKYGLGAEDALRIVKADVDDLTISELRIRYNNPNIGNGLPDWITSENLLNMCYKTAYEIIRVSSSRGYLSDIGYIVPDIAHSLYVYALYKINRFDNFGILKKALCDRCKDLLRQGA